jgi:DNA polymerase-3 subunit gamma/tau
VDADTLRQRWPEILDAVREERKVAWTLLRNTSVESFEGGVLTVAFPKEGEARGFAGSGHDQVLIGTLAAMMGVTVRVRTVASGPGAPGGSASPPAGPSSAGRPDTGLSAEPDDPPAADDAPAPGGRPGPSRGAGQGQDTGSPPAAPDNGNPGRPAGNAGAVHAERPSRRASSAQGPGGQRGRRGAQPSRPQAAPAEEQWPDEAAGPGADLAGMELIRRQLGGRVIEEIDDS